MGEPRPSSLKLSHESHHCWPCNLVTRCDLLDLAIDEVDEEIVGFGFVDD